MRLALKLAVPLVGFILLATAALVFVIWSGIPIWVELTVAVVLLVIGVWIFDRRDKARRGPG